MARRRWQAGTRRLVKRPRRASRTGIDLQVTPEGLRAGALDRGTEERAAQGHGVRHPLSDASRLPSVAVVRDPFDRLVQEGRLTGADVSRLQEAANELRRLAYVAGILRSPRNPLDQTPRGRAVGIQPEETPAETASRAYHRAGERIGPEWFRFIADLLVHEVPVFAPGGELATPADRAAWERRYNERVREALERLDRGLPRRSLLR